MTTMQQPLTEFSVPSAKPGGRNPGIELFRMVSMFLIVLLHVLGRGGVYANCPLLSVNYKIAWLLETVGYCSVNCYALISGYANAKNGFRFRRVVYLWLEVFFFTFTTTAFCALFIPSITVTKADWLVAFFPLTNKEYWYFNAYVLLFAFLPLLNKGLTALTKRQHLLTCIFLFVITSILPMIAGRDLFVLGGGYSAMWLMVLYLFGAYFRLHGLPRLRKWYITLPVFFLSALAAWGLKIRAEILVKNGSIEESSVLYNFLDGFISYTSPLMVIMALSLLVFFAGIPIRRRIPTAIITLFGKASFGVFLFHVGGMVWSNWLAGRYADYAALPAGRMTLAVLLTTLFLYLVWSLFSICRIGLFKLARIHKGVDFLADRIDKLLGLSARPEVVHPDENTADKDISEPSVRS